MPKKVIITTAGRLHFNSLKMNAVDGRGCGGIGVALKDPALKIIFSLANKIVITGADAMLRKKVENFAKNFLLYIGVNRGINIKIIKFFPGKVGLGSGTQLGMSVGRGISLLYGKKISLRLIAEITKRAGISGIGYYAFSKGGLIVDGGYWMGKTEAKKTFADHNPTPPPLIARYSFPTNWKVLLLTPKKSLPKISSLDEAKLFIENTPVPMKEIGVICTNVLMGIIPSLQEKDYFKFIEYLSKIGNLGTKKVELELNYNLLNYFNNKFSNLLARKLIRLSANKYYWQVSSDSKVFEKKYPSRKIPFLMLSSLGTTFYSILLDGYHDFDYIKRELKRGLPNDWTVNLTSVNNRPAKIDILQ